MLQRLNPFSLNIPFNEIRMGYRSAAYFNKAKKILTDRGGKEVTMQVFQKNEGVLCGMDEALAVIDFCTGYYSDEQAARQLWSDYLVAKGFRNLYEGEAAHLVEVDRALDDLWIDCRDQIEVKTLNDGDIIFPWEPVAHIIGDLQYFAHLESVYLGILARRTMVASNTRAVVDAAANKPVLFFADRFDHYSTQGGDGYAAFVGGAQGVATQAMAQWWGAEGMGTMPHALIAAFDGDLVAACQAYVETYPTDKLIALVDFHNDSLRAAGDVLGALGDKLWGVRLDTSAAMVDVSITEDMDGRHTPVGVNVPLVCKMREHLDKLGGDHVKIVVSGGFNAAKIAMFERENAPVDVYAVGSSLLKGNFDYTADVVQPIAKVGRKYSESKRLSTRESWKK